MSEFRKLEEQELLIDGYCKSNYTYNIPMMLIKMILSLYNETFYWKLDGEKLKQFLSSQNGQCIFSKTFTIKNITFQYFVYPKGIRKASKDKVLFGVFIKNMSDLIEYIVIHRTMDFDTIPLCKYHKLRPYTKTLKDKTSNSSHSSQVIWLNMSECQNITEIIFYGKLEILCIKPKDMINNKSLFYQKQGIKMKRKASFTWNIDGKLLEKIKTDFFEDTSVSQRCCSPYFDGNNWMIKLCRTTKKPQYEIRVLLYQFPENIKAAIIEYDMKIYRNKECVINHNVERKWDYADIHGMRPEKLAINKEFLSVDVLSLTVTIDIEVIKVFDFDDKEIDPQHWGKYHVV